MSLDMRLLRVAQPHRHLRDLTAFIRSVPQVWFATIF